MDNELNLLIKTNKITKCKDKYFIVINKPSDFVFDISELKVEYCPDSQSKKIKCNNLPENIVYNMEIFSFLPIIEYIKKLESNLNFLMMGKSLDLNNDELAIKEKFESIRSDRITKVSQSNELPSDFRFPTNNSVNPNVICDASISNNIVFYCCQKISILTECNNCHITNNISGNDQCIKCKKSLELIYIPIIDSEYLGFIAIKGCKFVCFNSLKYQYQCSECNQGYETKLLSCGEYSIQKCKNCHRDLKFRVNKIEFIQRKEQKFSLIMGNPLPEKGTCSHYKKSYRWFRFPCCNSLYPCDICHDEQSGHKCVLANKMICGFCSKEQSVKKDCECGMNIKRKNTAFWEGGKGNRDKASLSKKDRKKYH